MTAIQLIEPTDAAEAPVPALQQPQALQPVPQGQVIDYVGMALQRGLGIDQLEKVMALQERQQKRVAEQAYNDAFAAFKSEAVEIIKRKRVYFESKKDGGSTTNYKHAELSDVIEAVAPALSRHGFSYTWTTRQERDGRTVTWIEVTCALKHKLGHSESVTLGGPPDISGNKNPIQQIVSTVTYLERHTLKAITGVSEKGEDDDGQGGPDAESGAAQQPAPDLQRHIDAGLSAAEGGMEKLNTWWGSLTEPQRKQLTPHFGAMRAEARRVDARRA